MGGGNLHSLRYPAGSHSKTFSNLKIPIYEKLLNTVSGYEEAIVLNQILYFYKDGSRGFSIHDIARFSSYTKSVPTLRKRLESLFKKGFIERSNSFYRGLTYYKPCGDLAIGSNELASLIEKRDLKHGDYYTAAIINYFRQCKLAGEKEILVSHQELVSILQTDVGRLSIRKRIKELCLAGILKSTLVGRVTKYTLPDQLLSKEIDLETLERQSSELADYYTGHLARFNVSGKAENYILSFKRLLIDGFDYNKLKLIISYLGMRDNPYLETVKSVSSIGKSFNVLYQKASVAISKTKSDKYLYKLVNGHLKPISKTTPTQWPPKTIQHDNVVNASGLPAKVAIQTPQSQVPENNVLYQKSSAAISKAKSHKYEHSKPIRETTKATPKQRPPKTIQHDNVVKASSSPATAAIQKPQSQVPENILSKEEIWTKAIEYCNKFKGFINKYYNTYKAKYTYGSLLDEKDLYNEATHEIFMLLSKSPSTFFISYKYLGKILNTILSRNLNQSNVDIKDDYLEDPDSDIEAVDEPEEEPDTSRYSDTIKAKFKEARIPDNVCNIILDYFALNGIRYNQRELAKKYNKSLATMNRILAKYVDVLKELMGNLKPPS